MPRAGELRPHNKESKKQTKTPAVDEITSIKVTAPTVDCRVTENLSGGQTYVFIQNTLINTTFKYLYLV